MVSLDLHIISTYISFIVITWTSHPQSNVTHKVHLLIRVSRARPSQHEMDSSISPKIIFFNMRLIVDLFKVTIDIYKVNFLIDHFNV